MKKAKIYTLAQLQVEVQKTLVKLKMKQMRLAKPPRGKAINLDDLKKIWTTLKD